MAAIFPGNELIVKNIRRIQRRHIDFLPELLEYNWDHRYGLFPLCEVL